MREMNMTTRASIDDFMKQQTIAVVGASRSKRKFGNTLLRELKAKGYAAIPVNPHAENIEGVRCYPSLKALPVKVDGVAVVVPPHEAERIVRDAVDAGIPRVWLQQGAESKEAIRFCQEHGVSVVHGECMLMYACATAFPHRVHRFFRTLLGRMPQ
jgi:predicted CoA-binding protein